MQVFSLGAENDEQFAVLLAFAHDLQVLAGNGKVSSQSLSFMLPGLLAIRRLAFHRVASSSTNAFDPSFLMICLGFDTPEANLCVRVGRFTRTQSPIANFGVIACLCTLSYVSASSLSLSLVCLQVLKPVVSGC